MVLLSPDLLHLLQKGLNQAQQNHDEASLLASHPLGSGFLYLIVHWYVRAHVDNLSFDSGWTPFSFGISRAF